MKNRPKADSKTSSTPNRLHRLIPVAVTMFLATIILGCANTRGPELVINSHIDYNKAVSQVLKEELLLNVV